VHRSGEQHCGPVGYAAKRVVSGGGSLEHYFHQGASFGNSFRSESNVRAAGQDDVEVLRLWDASVLDEEENPGRSVQFRGTVFMEETPSLSYGKQFVSVTDIGVSFVSGASARGASVVAWVTRWSTGKNVRSAKVSLYLSKRHHDPELVFEGFTSSDGTLEFMLENSVLLSGHLSAVISVSDELFVWPDMVLHAGVTDPLPTLTVVTDRKVYKPGDSVSVKGYIRAHGDQEWRVPNELSGYELICQWDHAQNMNGRNVSHTKVPLHVLPFRIDRRFGSFALDVGVPKDASFGSTDCAIKYSRLGPPPAVVARVLHSFAVVIADPRPPTLKVSVRVDGRRTLLRPVILATMPLRIVTETYTGQPVGNAEVTVQWKVIRADRNSRIGGRGNLNRGIAGVDLVSQDVLSGIGRYQNYLYTQAMDDDAIEVVDGKVSLTTGANGTLAYDLRIGDMLASMNEPAECAEGDVVSVGVSWMGPTHEIVVGATTELKVGRSEWEVRLRITAASPNTRASKWQILPGKEFGVYADVVDLKGSSVLGKVVTVTLTEWDGTSALPRDATGRYPNASVLVEGKHEASSPCTFLSSGGRRPQCSMKLPTMGKYLLYAVVVDTHGCTVETVLPLGSSALEWQQNPLRAVEDVPISLDAASYLRTDDVHLSFYNPFSNAQLLVRWGNQFGWNMAQHALQPGFQTVSFALDDGTRCVGGCVLTTVLTAPNQKKEHLMPVTVPVSPLYYLESPRTLTQVIEIPVPDVDRRRACSRKHSGDRRSVVGLTEWRATRW
jgi:hypothetical protein